MAVPAFRVLRPIAEGTTGTVHQGELLEAVEDLPAGTLVAVKRPKPGTPSELFATEAEVLDAVRAPSLVRLIGHGEDADGPLVITEWLDGETLSDRVAAHGPIEASVLVSLAHDLAGALAALHAAGWLHGDIAPDNVRTGADGRGRWIDLGFATRVESGGRGRGTPAYLAPEELRGRAKDFAAEMFAFGLVLRTLATGAHPLATDVRGWLPPTLPSADGYDRVAPAWTVEPGLPPHVDALLEALLHPDPARRPDAATVHAALANDEVERLGAPQPRAVPRSSLPWVGRQAANEVVRQAWAAGRASGRPQVLWLSGRPGTGRTRFVREAVARLRSGPAAPLHLAARCGGAMESRPAQPVRALLRRWLNLPRHEAPGPREEAMLRALLPPASAEALVAALDPHNERPLAAEPALLAEWWAALAADRPLLVLLSDLDRSGRATRGVLARVVGALAETGALLVLDRALGEDADDPRWELEPRIAATCDVHELSLEPLDDAELLDLCEAAFVDATPTLRVAQALGERSDGRADRIEAVLRAARSSGQVRARTVLDPRVAERLELWSDPEDLPWPIDDPIALLADLDRDLRTWAGRCAVAGKRLDSGFLEVAWPSDGTLRSAADALVALETGGLLERRQGGLRFASPALRDAVLEDVDEDERRALHKAVAGALAASGDVTGSRAFERAYHLHQAGAFDELLSAVTDLIDRAATAGHPDRAVSLASWGLEALDQGAGHEDGDRVRFELLVHAADAAGRSGARDLERRALDRLVDLPLDPEVVPARVGRVYLLHGHQAADTGRYGLARGMLRNAARWLESGGDRDGASEARRRLAEVYLATGDRKLARTEALKARRRARSRRAAVFARLQTAEIALIEDRFEASLRTCDRILKSLRDEPDEPAVHEVRARASMLRSRNLRQLGRWRRAHGAMELAERAARRAGERALEAEASARRGRLLVELGREREALRVLRDALWVAREVQDARVEVLAELFLGTLLAEEDRPEGAEHLARAADLARDVGLRRADGLAQALMARVAHHAGDLDLADRRSQEAMASIEQVGAELTDRVVIIATRALVLEARGDEAGARALDARIAKRIATTSARLRSAALRQRHDAACGALLRAARSLEGPIHPRATADS